MTTCPGLARIDVGGLRGVALPKQAGAGVEGHVAEDVVGRRRFGDRVPGADAASVDRVVGDVAVVGDAAVAEADCVVLIGEELTYGGRSAVLTDEGENRCYCGEEEEVCTALSVGLEPPAPLE